MFEVLKDWYNNFFADHQATQLFIFIVVILVFFMTMGLILKPVITSVVIAYLLMGLVRQLERIKVPHYLAVLVVFISFIALVIFIILTLLPPLWREVASFVGDLPEMLSQAQQIVNHLPEKISRFISPQQVQHIVTFFKASLGKVGQMLLSYSLSTIPSLISLVLYFVLVPFLAYFFLADKEDINIWFSQFLPRKRQLITRVWEDINMQFGKYIQGRVLEIVIVSIVSYIAYAILGLQYAFLLAVLSGVSVVVPYIGAVVVTIPVLLVGLLQWGWTAKLAYLAIVYGVITVLAGYVLEPLLLAEAVNLHPVAIIVSIMVFGAWFGFWGVFFAIPLATIVKAIINAWPRKAATNPGL